MSTLITLPKTIKKGDIIEIKTLISHSMETGYRRDIGGKVIERDIIRNFEASFEGKTVFKMTLFPSIASDPFISFHFHALKEGVLAFIWENERGEKTMENKSLIFS